MATSGKTAWEKYFSGVEKIETSLKKDSSKYDSSTDMTIGSVKKGTKLIFINEGEYQSKALVKKDDDTFRVSFNSLAKPGSRASSRSNLKPQSFGIKEKEYSFKEIEDISLDTLSDREDLSGEVKAYLELLMLYHIDVTKVNDVNLTEAFQPLKNDINIRQAIINDFGELLGPFACLQHKLIDNATGNNITVPSTSKLWFPERPNEPLMDYGIIVGTGAKKRLLTISAKALSRTTNVVKPGDIIDLIKKKEGDQDLKRTWNRSIQYKILEILSDNSIAHGPLLAASHLVEKYPTLKKKYPGLTKEGVSDLITRGDKYDDGLWSTFFATNETIIKRPNKRGKVRRGAIRFACEKILVKECHVGGPGDMREIFADAITNEVFYVKFKIHGTGLPEWAISTGQDFREMEKVCLRTKNGYTREGDRMGVQP